MPVNTAKAPEPRAIHTERGSEFHFNEHVCVEMLLGVPIEKRTGRLVQIRKGCGQFGSDIYFVRLRDGSLMTFENVMIRRVDDKKFEEAFYVLNGRTPPVIPEQNTCDDDTETSTYTIQQEWPETGFIIEHPAQPETPGSFSFMITTDSST